MSKESVEIVRRLWDLWAQDPGNLGSPWDHASVEGRGAMLFTLKDGQITDVDIYDAKETASRPPE